MSFVARFAAFALAAALLLLSALAAHAADRQPPLAPPAASAEASERQHWQQRALAARQRVTAAEARVVTAEAAVTHMRARHYPRGEAAAALEKEVDSAKQELADAQKAQADLEDEARRAGVPPGWIRLDEND